MITLYYFYHTWNPYCKKTLNTIKEISNINLIKVNIDEESELVNKYKVKGSPTVIIESDNKIIGKVIGGGPLSYYLNIINNERV